MVLVADSASSTPEIDPQVAPFRLKQPGRRGCRFV
jgi:hypothetical protein